MRARAIIPAPREISGSKFISYVIKLLPQDWGEGASSHRQRRRRRPDDPVAGDYSHPPLVRDAAVRALSFVSRERVYSV